MRGEVYNGQCACGCGLFTETERYDNPASGRVAGQHKRYRNGHYQIHMRLIGKRTGEFYARTQLIESRRAELVYAVLNSDGTISLQEIASEVAPEFKLGACSRMINYARESGIVTAGRFSFLQIPSIRVKKPTPKKPSFLLKKSQRRPAYERPEIPYERETDIQLLVNRYSVVALDAAVFDGGPTGHERYGSENHLSPLEILLRKEQEEEKETRGQRIDDWNRWVARRDSAFHELYEPKGETAT